MASLIVYQHSRNLETFLADHKPSKEISPNLFWIIVPRNKAASVEPDIYMCQKLFKDLNRTSEDHKIQVEDITAIAQACNHTLGKWVLYRKPDSVDEVWDKIAMATVNGELGVLAKVSTRNGARSCKGNEHVICIYTEDFSNHDDVMRVERKLRDLGIKGKLCYKPDIYTDLGIYFNNSWGIKPNMYQTKG